MSFRNILMVPALLCATAAFGQGMVQSAHADIVNGQGQKIGTARFMATDAGVRIELNVSQLPPGTHGIHIHAVGKCEGPAFTTAGVAQFWLDVPSREVRQISCPSFTERTTRNEPCF